MSVELSIASASMDLSALKVQQATEIAMLKKTMEMQELQVDSLVEGLPKSSPPSASIIDVKA